MTATLRDISNTITSVDYPTDRDEADVTTLGATHRDFIPGVQDASINIEGVWDPTVDGYLDALGTATGSAFEYYPQGTASGKIKYSGSALRKAYNRPTSVDDAVTYTCDFHIQGAVTRATV